MRERREVGEDRGGSGQVALENKGTGFGTLHACKWPFWYFLFTGCSYFVRLSEDLC